MLPSRSQSSSSIPALSPQHAIRNISNVHRCQLGGRVGVCHVFSVQEVCGVPMAVAIPVCTEQLWTMLQMKAYRTDW